MIAKKRPIGAKKISLASKPPNRGRINVRQKMKMSAALSKKGGSKVAIGRKPLRQRGRVKISARGLESKVAARAAGKAASRVRAKVKPRSIESKQQAAKMAFSRVRKKGLALRKGGSKGGKALLATKPKPKPKPKPERSGSPVLSAKPKPKPKPKLVQPKPKPKPKPGPTTKPTPKPKPKPKPKPVPSPAPAAAP